MTKRTVAALVAQGHTEQTASHCLNIIAADLKAQRLDARADVARTLTPAEYAAVAAMKHDGYTFNYAVAAIERARAAK